MRRSSLSWALLGQAIGAVLGARYAANVNRRTQLELAEQSFQRQARAEMLKPILELAAARVLLVEDAIVADDLGTAKELVRRLSSERGHLSFVWGLQATGDEPLTAAGEHWREVVVKVDNVLAHTLKDGSVVGNANVELGVSLGKMLLATRDWRQEASRWTAYGPTPKPRRRWAWLPWRRHEDRDDWS